MSKIITTTFLLKNPAKVREMVARGIKLLVKHNGKVVMEIVLPKYSDKPVLPPKINLNTDPNDTYRRIDIYDGKYD
jgi:hypothetical protein